MMKNVTGKVVILLISLILVIGCSSGGNNPTVVTNFINDANHNLPVAELDGNSANHSLCGIWEASFDIESLSATIQADRTLNAHHNVTGMIPDPRITVNSWDPVEEIADVDIQLHNPTWATAYDVRLIIFTDDDGHTLLNADNWTPLWDIPGGAIANPFKAYAKHEINRAFTGLMWHQENFQIKCPNLNFNVQFAVDASYPGNCEEPYEISGFTQGRLTDTAGSSTQIEIKVYDWDEDVNNVSLYCPEITGVSLVPFTQTTPDTWSMELINDAIAPEGVYTGFILAYSSNSGTLGLYGKVEIKVESYFGTGWARTWGNCYQIYCNDVVVDTEGNVYVTGCFRDPADFDPGPGEDIRIPLGYSDTFICKYDRYGTYQWARTWGGDDTSLLSSDRGYGVAIDQDGNILVAGSFFGNIDFDPGPDVFMLEANGENDAYVSNFDKDGNFNQAKSFGGTGKDKAMDVSVDSSGNILLTGQFEGIVDFDPGPGIYELEASRCYINKLDSNGDFIWACCWGSDYYSNKGIEIKTDEQENVLVTGTFSGEVDFDPGPDEVYRTSESGVSIYLSKFAPTGDFIWVNVKNMLSSTYVHGLEIDSAGNCLIAGRADYGAPHEYWAMMFLNKIDTSGSDIWGNQWLYVENEIANIAYDVALDQDDNSYITGQFDGTIDFDCGPGEDEHIGNSSLFAAKHDSDGSFIWVQTWDDAIEETPGHAICTDDEGSVYIVGDYSGTIDFDPGPGVYERHCFRREAFLIKILPNGYWE
jgi:hypothetical protein